MSQVGMPTHGTRAVRASYDSDMSRLPPLTYDETDAEQRAVWDRVVETRSGRGLAEMTDDNGSLIGPFHAMATRPHLGAHMLELGRAVRFEGALERRLLEVAICTVGARWKSEFEFWAHRGIGITAGLDADELDRLAAGDDTPFSAEDEALVHRYASQLLDTGHPDEATWGGIVDLVGHDGAIDLTISIGYYCQISFVLNATAVRLPEGVMPAWDGT